MPQTHRSHLEQFSSSIFSHVSSNHLRLHRSEQQRRANHQQHRQHDLSCSIIGTSVFHPQETYVHRTIRSMSEPILHEEEKKCSSLHSMQTTHQRIPPTATIVIHSSSITSINDRKKPSSSVGRRKSSRQDTLTKQRPMTTQSIPRSSTQRTDLDFDFNIRSFGQKKALLDDKE